MSATARKFPRSTRPGNTDRPAQIELCNRLLAEVAEFNGEFANQVWADLKRRWSINDCTVGFVSDQIDSMFEAKKASRHLVSVPNLPEIPDGRYGLEGDDEADFRFYRVTNKAGRYTVFVYASDTQHIIRNWGTALGILRGIEAAGIEASALLFGQKSERCYRCGRRLTDAVSRERGLGPDCADKV